MSLPQAGMTHVYDNPNVSYDRGRFVYDTPLFD